MASHSSLWYHTTVWLSHTLYSCHHTQDTCHCIHCSWAITYSVLSIPHLQYVWSQTHYMYGITWILCDISTTRKDITKLYSWHHSHTIHYIIPTVYDITYTLLVTSQPCNYEKTPTMFLTLYSVYRTSQMVNEGQCHDSIWHDTECICVIKPTWLMKSHLMYIWNHTHWTSDTIGTLYDLTSTLADNTPLFVCHGTHSVYEIICIIYDGWYAVCMTSQPLHLACNLLKLPSHPLCISSNLLSQRHHIYCVRHQRRHMYVIKCTIQDIISTLYDNNIWYLWHYMHYIQYITCIIYDN